MLSIQLAHAQLDTRPKTKPQQQVLPQTGTLKIVSNAAGTIKIDGESKGNIEANGVRKFELRAGDYIVQLFPSDGSKIINKEISISAGQTETIDPGKTRATATAKQRPHRYDLCTRRQLHNGMYVRAGKRLL